MYDALYQQLENLYKTPNEWEVNIADNIIMNKQNEFLNSPFIMKELRNTIETLDKKKTTGCKNICNEFLKQSTDRILGYSVIANFSRNKRPNYIKLVFRYITQFRERD